MDDDPPPTDGAIHFDPRIGILSDDLTGAAGVAAMYARGGVGARVVLDVAGAGSHARAADVLVVDTNTRAATPEEAARVVRGAARALLAAGIRRIAKRIDTTLRGPIGPEVAALLAELLPDTLAVVVAAAPEAGRTCLGGRVHLNGRPLSEAIGVEDRPLALLTPHCGGMVAGLELARVREGAEAVARALCAAWQDGARVAVCDAEVAVDLETIARAVRLSGLPAVPVDPGGFTRVLWPPTVGARDGEAPPTPVSAPVAGWVLAVLGSPTETAARQVEHAVAAAMLDVIEIDGTRFAGRPGAVGEVIGGLIAALTARRSRVMGIRARGTAVGAANAVATPPAESDEDSSPASVAGEGVPRAVVREALATVVERVMRSPTPPAGLYLSGGDVARAVLDRLGAAAVQVDAEVLPLAAAGAVLGGPYAGLRIVTKGGMIGADEGIARCLRHLTGEEGGGP